MPAARYWRIVGIETYAGGDLELSELHLYGASGRLDAAATLTSTIAPTAGTLAALQDDNLGTTCRFAAAAVRAGGFAIAWDFGAGNTADNVGLRLGASADQSAFMAGCTLQYSADGSQWQGLARFARYAWPGVGAYTAAPAVGDPDYDKVALLLHGDGANGSTTFTDSSAVPKTVAALGGAVVSTAQSKWGGASISGENTAGARVRINSHADFDMGAGDFTVECWAYVVARNASNFECFVARRIATGYWGFWLQIDQATGCPEFSMCNTSFSVFKATSTTTFPLGQWVHLAGVRNGSQIKLFVNGVQAASTAVSGTNYGSTEPVVLLGTSDGDARFKLNGYIDDLRITKGVARYTANFTPPTEPFLNSVGGSGGTVFVSPNLHPAHSAAQIAASAPVPAHSTRSAPRLQSARDVEFGGPGTIYGTTKTKGTPANTPTKARVVLLHQRSKQPVRETWSDPVTGNFAFTGIDTSQQFLALAEDAAGNFRPVAASRLVPEVLP